MTDEKRDRYDEMGPERPDEAGASGEGGDDQAILDRLRALSKGGSGESRGHHAAAPGAGPRRARPVVAQRPPAASYRRGAPIARIVAPAVFLLAVIVTVALMFQSGLIGGGEPVARSASPTPAASASGDPSPTKGATKDYRVKAGDTLSGIAAKYNTSVTRLEALNPELSGSTLVAGQKIKVPNN